MSATNTNNTLRLYNHELSGNGYKVQLLLSLLGLNYELVRVDLMNGEHKQPDFLALNPFGQLPVLVDGNTVVSDSQAILTYLALKYNPQWFPTEPEMAAQVVRWLSVAANEISQGLAAVRLFYMLNAKNVNIDVATTKATAILSQLDPHLAERSWLVGEGPTIADVACFPYVALAGHGQIDLAPYPQVLAWIARVKQLPNFIAMQGL